MTQSQPFTRSILLGSAIALLLSPVAFPVPAQAQWWNPTSWFGREIRKGVPRGNRTGAAHRSASCPKVAIPLTALVPLYQPQAGKAGEAVTLGTTASDRPTLWFYVPYEIGDKISATLWQQTEESQPDAAGNVQYTQRQILTLPPTEPGLVGIQLPDSESPLAVDTITHWLLTVQCDPDDASATNFVNLSLLRVTPKTPISPAIAAAPIPAQLDAYTKQGLWNESITVLNTALCEEKADPALMKVWTKLLQDIGLKDIANQPTVRCSIVFSKSIKVD